LPISDLVKQFDDFLDEAHRLKTIYKPQICLLVGLETEYITSTDLDHLQNLLSNDSTSRSQYIVGSVHHVNEIPIDLDEDTFRKARSSILPAGNLENEHVTQDIFFSAYFDAQYDLITRFHPEIIGHIDLCRLYTPYLRFADYPSAWSKLERNVAEAAAYGALFEVNAAAFRKGWDSAYPGEDVLQVGRIRSF
jgi:histidinol-phosphatase (PHP family)